MVNDFIFQFEESQGMFLNGMCYYFALILRERFGGEICYAPIDNHFIARIDGRLYDASGDVTDLYTVYVPWDEYIDIDPIHADRIIKSCILKVR